MYICQILSIIISKFPSQITSLALDSNIIIIECKQLLLLCKNVETACIIDL